MAAQTRGIGGREPRAPFPVGTRFGRLVVLECLGRGRRPGSGGDARTQEEWKYRLRCDCGTTKEVGSKLLSSGSTSSCGCLLRDTGAFRGKVNSVRRRGRIRGLLTLPADHGDSWDE